MHALLSLPYLNVYLHDGPWPVLELQWLAYVGGAELRAVVTQAMALSQAHHAVAWIADDRRQGAIRPRDLEWAEHEVLAPLSALGLQRFAHLEAEDALHRRTVDALYQRALPSLNFAFRRFEDITQARAWASGAGS